MTESLEHALFELFKLPEEQQNAIASMILAELTQVQAPSQPTIADMIDELLIIQSEHPIEIEIPERGDRRNLTPYVLLQM